MRTAMVVGGGITIMAATALAGVGVQLGARRSAHASAPRSAARLPPPVGDGRLPAITPAPGGPRGVDPAPLGGSLATARAGASIEGAEDVAVRFAVAFARDGHGARAGVPDPFAGLVTGGLAEALRTAPASPALAGGRPSSAAPATDDVVVHSVAVEDEAADHLGLTVSVVDEGHPRILDVLVVPTPGGWRVGAVQL